MRCKKIGRILVDHGIITKDQLKEALRIQRVENKRIGDVMIMSGMIDQDDLCMALGEQFGLKTVDLDRVEVPRELADRIPVELAVTHRIVPVRLEDDVMVIAMADPLDLYTLDNLRFVVNCSIEPLLATRKSLDEAIQRMYGSRIDCGS